MHLTINDKEYDVPFDPMDITLDKFIEFKDLYGKEIDERYTELYEDKDFSDEDKQEILIDIIDDEAIAWFSFWTGLKLKQAKNLPDIQPLLDRFRLYKSIFLSTEEESIDKITETVEWRGEKWEIQDYKLNPAHKMCFSEVTTAKEATRQVKKLGESKWLAMKYLAVIFFRKVGESYKNEMVWEKSERMKLIGELPVAYAMRVGFFLSICVNILSKTTQFSPEMEMM